MASFTANVRQAGSPLALLFVCLLCPYLCADDNQPATCYVTKIRSCDEIWIVSSRHLDPCRFTPQQLCVRKLCGDDWEPRKIDDLLVAHHEQTDKSIVMYLHGYRLDYYWARRRGLETYQDLTVAQTDAPPIRFVIWAWPSEDNDRPVVSYPSVLRRSMQEGNVLGWFLAKAKGDDCRVGILSYSLGTQVLGSAFQVAHSCYGKSNICRNVAIGTVTNCRWPQDAQQANLVLAGMGKMLVVENRDDSALEAYQKGCGLRRCGSPLGLALLEQYDTAHKMQRIDVTDVVQDEHQIHQYLKHSCVARRSIDHLLGWEPRSENETGQCSTTIDLSPIKCELILHYEPGNPASDPRRKKRLLHR